MIEPAHIVEYGRPATAALAQTIADAQASDPLAPVTVIVSSNFAALSVRRVLGSGALAAEESARAGLANVSFVTPFRLIELVTADLPIETAPITNPVLGAAVRAVLADDPDIYRSVAQHEATEAALAGLFAELSNVDEQGLEAIADEGSKAAELAVGFHRRIAERLTRFHTEHDLATLAAQRPDLSAQLVRFGHIIWYLPAPLTPALGAFVGSAMREAPAASVIVGISGVEDADNPVRLTCEVADVTWPAARVAEAAGTVVADTIVSVTDAPEEIREVCQRILALAESGTPLHRIGVFCPSPDPYIRIIQQQFDTAGIPSNGPDPGRLADSVAGRTLLGALALPDERWRRHRVIDVVSSAPIRRGDGQARPTVWDDLSREAGVVVDLGDWRRKLQNDAVRTRTIIDDLAARPPSGRPAESITFQTGRLRERLTDGAQLLEFVERLSELVTAVQRAESWPDKCAAATTLLQELLGGEGTHTSWPDDEQDAFQRVEETLVRLAALDTIEPAPTHAVFQRALRGELDVARGRTGRFGHGVLYGPISAAAGQDLDAVFVVGTTEGLLPMPRRDDAILPDRVRVQSLDQLEPKAIRLHHQHRAYLAALASAPPGNRTLVFPRGDIRSNRRGLPSRWLLTTASALAGRTVFATDFGELGNDIVTHVDSHAAAVRYASPAASLHDRDLADLARFADAGGDVRQHPLARLVGAGFDMQHARSGSEFTKFDGNLASRVGADMYPLPAIGDRPLSPSRLERWADCGFRYFLTYVLEVTDRDDPDRTDELSALDRGSLIHRALERFVDEVITEGPPAPSEQWSVSARRRLHEIADEECRLFEDAGRTGRAANWRVQRDDLHDVLDAFLISDNSFRAAHGATPSHVELDLGVVSGDAVPVDLPNGETVTLRGMVDRVDVTDSGGVIVSDYKSGGGKKYAALDNDPFIGGTTLQLGLYAEGAMRATGRDRVAAHYWLVENEQRRVGYEWTDEKRDRFHEVLAAITTGIGTGVFAPTPGEWDSWRLTNKNCGYCDFDSVCPRDRGDQADAKADAPELAVRLTLTPTSEVDS